MAIKKYEKDGDILWQVYVDLRSRKDRRLRAQQRVNGLFSERYRRGKAPYARTHGTA